MAYRIRITRPEHPQILLRVDHTESWEILGFQEVYRVSEASSLEHLFIAGAIIAMLRDARPDNTTPVGQLAWQFMLHILRFEPWKKSEPTAEEAEAGAKPVLDTSTAPDDWARRMIRGATLDILDQKGGVVDRFSYEVPANFDVGSLEPLDYTTAVSSPQTEVDKLEQDAGYEQPKVLTITLRYENGARPGDTERHAQSTQVSTDDSGRVITIRKQ